MAGQCLSLSLSRFFSRLVTYNTLLTPLCLSESDLTALDVRCVNFG